MAPKTSGSCRVRESLVGPSRGAFLKPCDGSAAGGLPDAEDSTGNKGVTALRLTEVHRGPTPWRQSLQSADMKGLRLAACNLSRAAFSNC